MRRPDLYVREGHCSAVVGVELVERCAHEGLSGVVHVADDDPQELRCGQNGRRVRTNSDGQRMGPNRNGLRTQFDISAAVGVKARKHRIGLGLGQRHPKVRESEERSVSVGAAPPPDI